MRNVIRSMMLSMLCAAGAQAQTGAPPPAQPVSAVGADQQAASPEIQELGNQRYRIGDIEIDRGKGLFTVSGRVLRDGPPLEFLLITRGGEKAYEALMEADADAFEFNLACILIGLDSSRATHWEQRNSIKPMQGDPVEITVSWLDGDKRVTVSGSDLLVVGEPPQPVESHDWVYTGSAQLNDGRYLANLSGTLIGFVHRAETVIEHVQGIGLGDFGGVSVDGAKAPPVGAKIELQVRRLRAIGKTD